MLEVVLCYSKLKEKKRQIFRNLKFLYGLKPFAIFDHGNCWPKLSCDWLASVQIKMWAGILLLQELIRRN